MDTALPERCPRGVYRHRLPVRITHWLNLIVLVVMLGSGLQIFNAHPALYWGERSDPERAWLAMAAIVDPHTGERRGITRLFGREYDTTGVLALSDGTPRGFPAWSTIPSDRWLAMGRRWHFFFAWVLVLNGLAYLAWGFASRHVSRDLWLRGDEARHLPRTLKSHLSLRALRADAEQGYNPLQKITYLVVIFVMLPLMVLTGLAMSPWLDAAFPALITTFDGRQSARSIHFIITFGLVLFTLVHVLMVFAVGPLRELRAMITGWFTPREQGHD
ncbi:MAG: cytochrome b/b6 domain-containing protein [Thiohalomonadaceae bacterium]